MVALHRSSARPQPHAFSNSAGITAGIGYRVITAGNIGGGFVILVGPVFVAALIVVAIVLGTRDGKAALTPTE